MIRFGGTAVLGLRLDLMTLKVFSHLTDSMVPYKLSFQEDTFMSASSWRGLSDMENMRRKRS